MDERLPAERHQELMDEFMVHFDKSETKGPVLEMLRALNSLQGRPTS